MIRPAMILARRRPGPIETGQAVVETAYVIPALLLTMFAFVASLLAATASMELTAATQMAAVAAAASPAGPQARANAEASWRGTLHSHPYLVPVELGGCEVGEAGAAVTCTGSARLSLRGSPLRLILPVDIPLGARAVAYTSPYRSG